MPNSPPFNYTMSVLSDACIHWKTWYTTKSLAQVLYLRLTRSNKRRYWRWFKVNPYERPYHKKEMPLKVFYNLTYVYQMVENVKNFHKAQDNQCEMTCCYQNCVHLYLKPFTSIHQTCIKPGSICMLIMLGHETR